MAATLAAATGVFMALYSADTVNVLEGPAVALCLSCIPT